MRGGNDDREERIRSHCERGEYGAAIELGLQAYGSELLGFIGALLRDRAAAVDVYADVRERLLKGVPAFRWQSSFRSWAYSVARNVSYSFLRSPAAHEEPLSQAGTSRLMARERSATQPWQRTEVKERFRALRESLSMDERTLLLLRVDRNLPWTEVARVMSGPEEPLEPEAIEKKATALRQQFRRLKQRLRALAEERGLVPEGEDAPAPGRH